MQFDVYSFGRYWLVIAAAVAVIALGSDTRCEALGPSHAWDPYPLPNCVVLDSTLDECAEVLDVGDREIRVCCDECVQTFCQNHDIWMDVVDDQIIEQEMPFYPQSTCLVDAQPLDGAGEFDFVFRNRLFRLCSDRCREALEQQPAKYFGLLDQAVIKKQKGDYPLATCIVSGKPLGKEAIDYVVGNQLIRLAGLEQLDKFNESPGEYLQELRSLAKKEAEKERAE